MVKVGIAGCDNLRGAELVRILINHPDVDLMWVKATSVGSVRLDEVVPGIVGECGLMINPEGELGNVDVVFTCGHRDQCAATLETLRLNDDTHIIDLSGCHNLDDDQHQSWKYGLSEMQRRNLVHDTMRATVPGNAAMVSLLALLPMARNLLLNSPIELRVAMGETAFPEQGKTIDGLDIDAWAALQQQEVVLNLKRCQSSFDQDVKLTISPLAERRTLAVDARFRTSVDSEMIRQLYDHYYSDHNFVFLVDRPIVTADVENTNKCLLYLEKDDSSQMLTIHAVMDLLLKGSAGTAVHVMNLLFGLHERVGLNLKATGC